MEPRAINRSTEPPNPWPKCTARQKRSLGRLAGWLCGSFVCGLYPVLNTYVYISCCTYILQYVGLIALWESIALTCQGRAGQDIIRHCATRLKKEGKKSKIRLICWKAKRLKTGCRGGGGSGRGAEFFLTVCVVHDVTCMGAKNTNQEATWELNWDSSWFIVDEDYNW